MLLSFCLAFFAVAAAGLAVSPTENGKSLITPGPKIEWDELKKRRIIYYYYYVDYAAVTTCGYLSHALAVQNGLYGTSSAAAAGSAPFAVTCKGYCAQSGNFLDCVDRKTQMVATTCRDYSAKATNTACYADEGCYWDMACSLSATPYCNTIIYGGSITQFTCGAQKYSPMTIDGAGNYTAFTAMKANVTRTASSTTSSKTSSDSDSVNVAAALQKIGLSVGALVGICVGALALCCISCCGWCWWSSRRNAKQKYGKAPYMQADAPYQPAMLPQQPLVPQAYQCQPQQQGPGYERYEQYRHR